ncbi:MAG: LCP family protein, partial [bacterium]
MSENNLNLLPAQENKNESSHFSTPKTKRPWKKIILLIITIALIGSFFSFLSSLFSDNGLIRSLAKLNLFSQFTQLITNKNLPLMGAENDRINILVMGIGGKNHDGGTLADTMFLGSYKPSTKQAALMSIPRDLWVKTDRFGYSKINAINAYAEAKNPGSGGQATLDVVNKLLDTKIPYFITIDFDGFERVIDEFGGVDIYVDRDLIDYQYPIRGKEMIFPIENRFETLNIKKGQHHFDGAMALKYARSRHALGAEGSDFARSKRQQKIITAMKEKIVSLDTLFNPSKLNSLLTAYNEHIVTNLQLSDLLQLAQWGKDIDQTQITSVALSDAPNGFLYADNLNGAYVLLPNVSDFSEIKNVWNYIFYKNQETKISTREPQLVSTEAKISDTNTTKTTTTKIIT